MKDFEFWLYMTFIMIVILSGLSYFIYQIVLSISKIVIIAIPFF